MLEPGGMEATQALRPMICPEEVDELSGQYGMPRRCSFRIPADEYIYSFRWRKDLDRRAEVVFAIEDDHQGIWTHTKPHYPVHIFRLPSGGIHWDEAVERALYREVAEETGLSVRVERFVAIIEYQFYRGDSTVSFASYVFHLKSEGGIPIFQEGEPISAFYAVAPCRLAQIAEDLRSLNGDRRGWGQWRSLAHDVVHDYMVS